MSIRNPYSSSENRQTQVQLKQGGKNRIHLYISMILFRVALDLAYVLFVSPLFAYSGFYLDVDIAQYIISWVLYLGILPMMPISPVKFSDFFFAIAILLVYGPLTSLYSLDANLSVVPVMVTGLSFFIVYLLTDVQLLKPIRIPYLKNSYTVAVFASILAVLYLIFWYTISGAVSNFNLDVTKVYDFRRENEGLANVGILTYFNIWVYSIINIFLIILSLNSRNFLAVSILLLVQVFFFGVSAHKSVLALPVIVIIMWFIYHKRSPSFYSAVYAGSLAVLLTTFYALYTSDILIASLFVRRVLFVPSQLTFSYFEFYGQNPFVFWSNSVLSFLSEYPYTMSISELVGAYMGSDANANNGYISSGYAHAGVFGVVIYSIIFGYLLVIINSFSKSGLKMWLTSSLLIIPLQKALMSSDLLTTLLTHGFLLAMLLLIMIRER